MKTINDVSKKFSKATLNKISYRVRPEFFQLSPHDYLNFASSDIKSDDLKSAVNASGNITKALDVRVEELLHNWGFYPYLDKLAYSFEAKIDLLKSISLLSPLERQNLSSLRAKVEEDFVRPEAADIQSFMVAVSMFIKYTDRVLGFDSHVEIVKNDQHHEWLNVNIDPAKACFAADYFERTESQEIEEAKQTSIRLVLSEKTYDDYVKALRWWLKFLEQ